MTIAEALAHNQAHADLAVFRFQALGLDIDADTELAYFHNDGTHKFVADTGHAVEIWSPIPPTAAVEPAAAAVAEPAPKRRRRAEPAA